MVFLGRWVVTYKKNGWYGGTNRQNLIGTTTLTIVTN